MRKYIIAVVLTAVLMAFKADRHEEGMFPMSHLSNLDLKKAGLEMDIDEIYNESKPSLVNALVRLGGCTGSFISDEGLIITNHHCVFGSVARASSAENNYLENGFYASSSSQELKTSLPCKITQSYTDVSDRVLEGVNEIADALEKQRKINSNIKAIVQAEEESNPNLTIEVSEMLVGKSYTLFRYKMLNDVRLVYVPPKNIGKFGGDTDNWEWPRHNADFAIVRAYENGKPYRPEKHMQVNPAGTKEGDFTFILGYPGRTYRNQTAQFLDYQNKFVLPIIADWFNYRIKATNAYAGDDVDLQLKYSGSLASLNNTAKNFEGKMQGLQRTNVIAQTYKDQEALKNFASQNDAFASYLPLFEANEKLYNRKFELSRDLLYLYQFYNTGVFSAASTIAAVQGRTSGMSKKECQSFLEENKESLQKQLGSYFGVGEHDALDETLFVELFYRLSQSEMTDLSALWSRRVDVKDAQAVKAYASEIYRGSKLDHTAEGSALFSDKPGKFFSLKSELVKFATDLNPIMAAMQAEVSKINAEINTIIPRFNDLEMEVNGGSFIPDANSTLRFTYGYVKGYEPEDAVVFSPYTTIAGILQKTEGSDNIDYFLQEEFVEKLKTVEPADVLKHPDHDSVVVAFLYNMDTTGGNSGSPIMDSKGRLVGVNFDRAYTATINDYAWNESYSRSIGVDIRYVLYIMKYFGEADAILDEMGVEL